MWTSDRDPAKPAYFDEAYASNPSIWREPSEGMLERIGFVKKLLGPHEGLSILDLGGGPLLAKPLEGCKRLVVVDYSHESLKLARELSPLVETVQADINEYLRECEEQFNVTIAMGYLEYGPSHGLDYLFLKAPSKTLILYVPIVEAYVLHIERTSIPSREDVERVAKYRGWETVEEIFQKEHVFAKFRRVK